MVTGKALRLARITKRGRMLCVPIDHAVTNGPIPGLEKPWRTVEAVGRGGASAVLAHKGVFKSLPEAPNMGLILHLNANTALGPAPNRKVLVASVEEAIRLGVDAVSVHINIGSDEEAEMLQHLGAVADECDKWGLPLIAMMYPRGPRIKAADTQTVAHVARVGAELGADIVKTILPDDPEGFKLVVDRCPVPVVLAGGVKVDDDLKVLEMAQTALDAGAIGITFGRNIFAHREPEKITRALALVVYEGLDASSAFEQVFGVVQKSRS
ncbi:MAG: 2-amino-3,7-dideoxy-D-threo-hept-6-ulosonate synthase [Thermoprotei archaeon]